MQNKIHLRIAFKTIGNKSIPVAKCGYKVDFIHTTTDYEKITCSHCLKKITYTFPSK